MAVEQLRVLVIDDSSLVAEAIRGRLQAAHFEVVVVNSGEEAVAQVSDLKPDIVTVDANMPGMDGTSAIKLLREQLPTAVILMLTGRINLKEKMDALRAGADDYMVKDPGLPELPARLRLLVEVRRKRSQQKAAYGIEI